MSDTKEALMACPFCGGEASANTIKYAHSTVKLQGWGQDTFHGVNCIKCGADNKGLVGFHTKEGAISAWNRRTSPPSAPANTTEAKPEQVTCGNCGGSGRMVRDPDIGTDQECFACDGTGQFEDAALSPPSAVNVQSEREFEELLGKYWELAYSEGRDDVSHGDKANEVLHKLRTMYRAARALPPAVRVPQWISVHDRLPEPETDVLVRVLRNGIEEGFDVAGIFHDEWMSFATEADTKGEVTHWMPLPPPPTSQGGE